MDKKKQPHLTAEERYQISALHRNKIGNNEIARQLGRDKGTISRELSRNKGSRGYHPQQAQTKATERRSSACKATMNSFGWGYVTHLLVECKWSPEQIHGRLTYLDWEGVPSTEHIYRYIYAQTKRGGTLTNALRCQVSRKSAPRLSCKSAPVYERFLKRKESLPVSIISQ